MEVRKEDVALDIVRWIAKHGVQPYAKYACNSTQKINSWHGF